jgi:CRISPR-associated protein Csm2
MPYSTDQVIAEVTRLRAMSELKPESYAEEDGLADSFIQGMAGDLKAAQLRKVFHQIKDMRRKFKHDMPYDRTQVALVMPTLAYAVGRKLIPDDFYQLMKICFGQQRCRTQQDFESAADFLEAIMAYHKYRDGMKKKKED